MLPKFNAHHPSEVLFDDEITESIMHESGQVPENKISRKHISFINPTGLLMINERSLSVKTMTSSDESNGDNFVKEQK